MCTDIHGWYTNDVRGVVSLSWSTWPQQLKCQIKWGGSDHWCKGGLPTVGCIWLTAVTCECISVCWALTAKHLTGISNITCWLPICNLAMLEISVYCDDISNVTGFQIGLLSRNNVVHMKQSKKKTGPKHPLPKLYGSSTINIICLPYLGFLKEKYSVLS